MIKVLELIDGGFIGGGQTHILSLAKCIDKSKFKITIAASGKGEFKDLVVAGGFEFCEIELPKFYRSKHLKKLQKIVQENSIDIIHSHGGVAGMYSRFFAKKYGNAKVIHTIHGIHYLNSGLFRKFSTLSIEQYLVPYTNRFICVSDSDFEIAKSNKIIDSGKTSVIKNGIDIGRFARNKKDPELMSKYGIAESDFIVGNISRFDFQKNQRLIISAAQEILSHPHVKILLVGDGKYLNDCKTFINPFLKDRIIFTGSVKDPENFYSLMDVFVFPSLWEGLSITLIEAMAASSCILAGSIPSNRELINDNINGLLFDLNRKDEFVKKVDELISDDSLRGRLSQNASADAVNFSDEAMSKKTEREYLNLMNDK